MKKEQILRYCCKGDIIGVHYGYNDAEGMFGGIEFGCLSLKIGKNIIKIIPIEFIVGIEVQRKK